MNAAKYAPWHTNRFLIFQWAGNGITFIGLSIPYASAYKRHAKNAVQLYNDGLLK